VIYLFKKGDTMPENLLCKTQKANSKEYNANYPCIFTTNHDIIYPEEIREREIERVLKNASKNKED